jgi:hypothetical protein
MLLLPSAVVAVYILVWRRWRYAPVLSFSLTTVVVSSAESVYTVFVLKRFDEKFRHAPNAAVEISLFGDAITGWIGLLFFGGTFAYVARQGRYTTVSSIILAAVFGGIYATLPNVLNWWHIEVSNLMQWIWIFVIPVAAALLTVRRMIQGRTERTPVPR